MSTTKLAVLEFLAGGRSGWRGLSFGAALLCACSVYDSRLLPGRGTGGITEKDSGPGTDVADGGTGGDAALVECKPGEYSRCPRPHADATCAEGTCVLQHCLDGYVDCDGDSANGCEAKLDTTANCSLCGAACRYNRATASCSAGRCALAICNAGYGNCDADAENGCETDLSSLSNCGECGHTCSAATNAIPGCKNGKCAVGSCIGPFGDCDGDFANGCEQRLNTSDHCGACDGKCAPAHGEGTCASGACVVTRCDPGFENCNGVAADGCETALDGADDCGACGASCTLAHVTQPSCEKSNGDYRCIVNHQCDPEFGSCHTSALENGCEKGYGDCDKDVANGCEADLSRLTNCGACGNSCVKANTTSECREGKCVDTGCAPGAEKCGDKCVPIASDGQNCGGCDQACSDTASQCAGGKCTDQNCSAGRADCDGRGNDCEVDLTSTNNCGVCGLRCPDRPHANGVCRMGACGIGNCDPGWQDCDGDPNNGCEVNIRTQNDCGDCAKTCIASNAETSCSNNGSCQITRCNDGRANCDNKFANGCEADLSLPTTCGGCNNMCTAMMDVVSSSCEGGNCNLVCASGRANCDGSAANGCEADLTMVTSCGSCKNNCSALPNVASATCDAGTCDNIMCLPGFADCNGDPTDGCESSLSSVSACGACDRACAPAHAQGQCMNGGACGLMQCDTGFSDCNHQPGDGCETPLSTSQNCGGCGIACPNDGPCTNGKCGCNTDADCGEGNSCCDGVCADTSSACFVWPCIPGTEAPGAKENCGGCGMYCLLWCCQGL